MHQARQAVGQIFAVLCAVSALLLFYTALTTGNSALGVLGCVDAVGAYLFVRRSRAIGEALQNEAEGDAPSGKTGKAAVGGGAKSGDRRPL